MLLRRTVISFSRTRRFFASFPTMQQTLTEAIKEDHEEMYEYHAKYIKAKGNVDEQARWARQLTWEIARHAVAEGKLGAMSFLQLK